MLKPTVGLAVLLLAGGCVFRDTALTYAAPPPPNGYQVVDTYRAGRPRDYVKIHHEGSFERLGARLVYHDPRSGEWLFYGDARLTGFRDTDTLGESREVGGGLRSFRYLAVRFSDGKSHGIRCSGEHHDLHLHVGD